MDVNKCLNCPYMDENAIGDFCDILKRPLWALKSCPRECNSKEEIKEAERDK